jgi:phosphoglucomutase
VRSSLERMCDSFTCTLTFFPLIYDRYVDPVDGSNASNQGLIMSFEYGNGDPARVVFRLSGTGSAGATVRVYLEKFEGDVTKHGEAAPSALKSLACRALSLVKMTELTGRAEPTVIT